MKIYGILSQIYGLFLQCFYPEFCVACGKYGGVVCSDCFNTIECCTSSICLFCGRLTTEGKVCEKCRKSHKFIPKAVFWTASYHHPVVKELLHNFKYNTQYACGDILAEMLFQRLKPCAFPKDLIVIPVPLHKNKLKKRGFNQSEILARAVSGKLNLHGGTAMRRVIETKTQVGLTREQRMVNMHEAFVCSDPELIQGKSVLLIDDVVTTGSTLNECAKVLKSAGAKAIYVATVARG